ncbi:hypothetical protein ACWF0M_22310 [Kribbella sp. NPDC055110]
MRGRTREIALAAMAAGERLNAISKRLGVCRAALRDWRDGKVRPTPLSICPRCGSGPLDTSSYAHLLGLYLGDGCLSRHRRTIALADWQQEIVAAYP